MAWYGQQLMTQPEFWPPPYLSCRGYGALLVGIAALAVTGALRVLNGLGTEGTIAVISTVLGLFGGSALARKGDGAG